jgi:TonB family protein
MKVPTRNLLITVSIHLILLLFFWSYTLNSSFTDQKKSLTLELYGQPEKIYGISSLGEQKSAIDNSQSNKHTQKKYSSDIKDDNVVSNNVDSLPDTSKLAKETGNDPNSLQQGDTAGGSLYAYGTGQLAELPSFAGGGIDKFREWMIYNIKLSSIADKRKISGTILITFIINTDGEVTNVTVQKGINPQIDNEAVRIVRSSPRWTPGKQQGQPVRIIYKLPLTFSL